MGVQAAPGYIADPTFDHPAELDRNILEGMFPRTGMVEPGNFALSVGVGTRAIAVAAGRYVIEGAENATQGSYFVWSDAAETHLLAAAVGNPRIDSFILRVADNQYGSIGGAPEAYIDVVQGVAAGSPTARPDSDFQVGGPFYIPGAWARLGDVRVNTADTGSIPANQITNRYAHATPPGQMLYVSSGSRPTAPATNEVILESDTGFKRRWNGSSWLQDDVWRTQVTLGANAAQLEVTGIPSTFRKLRIEYFARCATGLNADNLLMRVNNVAANHAYNHSVTTNTTNAGLANDQGNTYFAIGIVPGTGTTANFWGSGVIDVLNWNYANSIYPRFHWQSGMYGTTAAIAYNGYGQGLVFNAGPFTQFRFVSLGGGNILAGSWCLVEGWE